MGAFGAFDQGGGGCLAVLFQFLRVGEEKDLGLTAGILASQQTCRKDPGVIDDQQVACVEQIDNVGEAPVLPDIGCLMEDKEPGFFPFVDRVLGDISGRQMVVVGLECEILLHGCSVLR